MLYCTCVLRFISTSPFRLGLPNDRLPHDRAPAVFDRAEGGFPPPGAGGGRPRARRSRNRPPFGSAVLLQKVQYIIADISCRAAVFPPELRSAHYGMRNGISGGRERRTHPAKCWLQRNVLCGKKKTKKASPCLEGMINKREFRKEKVAPIMMPIIVRSFFFFLWGILLELFVL